jgi:hypothetical protein
VSKKQIWRAHRVFLDEEPATLRLIIQDQRAQIIELRRALARLLGQ